MPAKQETRSGLFYGWDLGEDNWASGMDANLLQIGRFAHHLSVKDRNLATPPALPADGDTYIIAASASGAWAGKSGHVAVWVAGTPAGSWVFGAPCTGWVAFVEDENKLTAFYGGQWSAGVVI